MDLEEKFQRISQKIAKWSGSIWAFVSSVLLVLIWLAFGPHFNWNSDYNLFINSITTIINFWMVFIIQNTQNRNDSAIQLKLDEIIRGIRNSRNRFIKIEDMTDKELKALSDEMKAVKQKLSR